MIGMIITACKCCDRPAEKCEYTRTLFEMGAYEFIDIEEREVGGCPPFNGSQIP